MRLTVYDVTGRLVEQLVSDVKPAGEHFVEWTGVNAASGVYFYRLEAGTITETRKMMLVK